MDTYTVDDLIADLRQAEQIKGKRYPTSCSLCGKKDPDSSCLVAHDEDEGAILFFTCCADKKGKIKNGPGYSQVENEHILVFNSTDPAALARKFFYMLIVLEGSFDGVMERTQYKSLKFWDHLPRHAVNPFTFLMSRKLHKADAGKERKVIKEGEKPPSGHSLLVKIKRLE